MMLAMIQDPTSLDNLHDIVVPDPGPWWPPAVGWLVFVSLVAVGVAWLCVHRCLVWYKNRYRGAALAELNRIKSTVGEQGRHRSIRELDHVLKRVALSAWPRQQVASLSGDRWIDFLNQNGNLPGGRQAFNSDQVRVIRDIAYSSKACQRLTEQEFGHLFDAAELWIRRHQVPRSLNSPSEEKAVA